MARSDSKKTTGIKLSDFLAEKGKEPRPIYVLRGTDPYLLDQARRHVRAQTVGDADPGLAVVETSGADAVLADVMDSLRTLPFLAPRRLVNVREAEDFLEKPARKGETVRDVLLDYMEKPASTGSLCLEVSGWNESTNLAKSVAKKGLLVICELTDAAILPDWLRGQATKLYKKNLSLGAAQMLVESLGTDFASLLSALDALALYAGAAEKIDAPDVDALVARGHHERVWALCDAVAEHKVARALELLDIFWTEGMVAPQIVGLLRPTLRQLLRVKALSRKMSPDAAMEKVFVNYYARDRVRKAVKAFSDAHLADAYQALVDADLEAKTTPNDRMVMETLIHRLCLPEAAHGVSSASAE
ncbi:MAG: DNA polymerase III subunit delta [Planctomycetota bacterium]|nr:DNA polymerase III subunit delta [Planctomycetota bacterium]